MTRDAIEGYLDGMSAVLGQIGSDQVQGLVDVLSEAWANNATVFTCGNGGSASTASHMATDLAKQTAVAGRRGLKAISLTDNVGSFTAWANDAGFDEAFARQIENLGSEGDVLVCFSCSGVSANIVRAIDEAHRKQMSVLAIGGFDGGPMSEKADAYVHVPSHDYGQVESAHLVVEHCVTAALRETAMNAARVDGKQDKPVVVVDRDGVINRNLPDGVISWDDFEFLPGALSGLALLREAGHQVVVVTNQANIGRGILTRAQLDEIHRRMHVEITAAGGVIDAIYVCEHLPEDGCLCRKPAPGLLRRAAQEMGFSLDQTYVIGDHRSDVAAARAAGAYAVLVLSGREDSVLQGKEQPDFVVAGLREAAELLMSPSESRTQVLS
jgi:histidinol-phosphate phosphatase family protein